MRIEPFHVVSSNLQTIGYLDGTLYIEFKNGSAYAYDKVPYSVFDALLKAESAGKFFHSFIRAKYAFRQLEFNPFAKVAA